LTAIHPLFRFLQMAIFSAAHEPLQMSIDAGKVTMGLVPVPGIIGIYS